MEPDAVSHYREAGVNFLLIDGAGLQIGTSLKEEEGGLGCTQLFRR